MLAVWSQKIIILLHRVTALSAIPWGKVIWHEWTTTWVDWGGMGWRKWTRFSAFAAELDGDSWLQHHCPFIFSMMVHRHQKEKPFSSGQDDGGWESGSLQAYRGLMEHARWTIFGPALLDTITKKAITTVLQNLNFFIGNEFIQIRWWQIKERRFQLASINHHHGRWWDPNR